MTREEWLLAAVDELRPTFAAAGEAIPDKVRVSVGWPGGRGPKRHVVGQCWMPAAVSDGVATIFVSPVHETPLTAIETLAHELVHACGHSGHRGGFARLAAKVGMVAPFKQAPAGPDLKERLHAVAEGLGPFDHGRITPGAGRVAQGTRMLKVACPDCGYVVRTTQKWLDIGLPTCVCGTEMELAS